MSLASVESIARPDVDGQPSRLAFKINNFDLIRLFAALQVAVFHAYERLDLVVPAVLRPLSWFQGVPIFFIISGFLISASLERQSSLFIYARNRALRIFPGLWACVLATVVATAIFGFSFLSPQALIWLLLQLAGVIYTPDHLKSFGDGSYNGSLWTIPLELQFYVVLVILYRLVARTQWKTGYIAFSFFLFLIIGCVIKLSFPIIATAGETPTLKLLRYTFVPRIYLFLFGVLLQQLQAHALPYIRSKALYWLIGYALVNLFVPQIGLVYVVDELILGVTVISAAYTLPTIAERLLRGNDISYGIYLYHGLIINLMIETVVPVGAWSVLGVLGSAIAIGLLSWLIVERPAMQWKSWDLRRSFNVARAAS